MHRHLPTLASLALAIVPLSAQDRGEIRDPAPTPTAHHRVPLHTAPADPVGGDYGTWAMGDDYKVGFDDAVRFVPLLGSGEPENLPLVWRTDAVRCGTADLTTAATDRRHGDDATDVTVTAWRHARRSGAVTEIHDVLPHGVAQSFVIDAVPAERGAIVVAASISGPLRGDERGLRHGPLTFRDAAGRPVVEYGAAFAFDARGQGIDVPTRCDGDRVELVVDADWVATAELPITIDPLIRVLVPRASSDPLSYCDIVRDDGTDEFFYVFSVAASAGDLDQVGFLVDDALTGEHAVFADISSSWSSSHGRVTHVAGADRFLMAMMRIFPNTSSSRIRAYVHLGGDHRLNAGTTLFLNAPSGVQDAIPAVGGVHRFGSDARGLVVFRRDLAAFPNDTDFSQIRAVVVDCASPSLGTDFSIGGDLSTIDAQSPSVNRMRQSGGDEPWIVTWQEHSNRSGAAWSTLARQVFPDGRVTTHAVVAPGDGGRHRVQAEIDGTRGRYLAVWVEQPNTRKNTSRFGRRIEARRFDWPADGAASLGAIRLVAEHPTRQNLQLDASHPIAFDIDTDSHWMVAWAERDVGIFARRLGFDGESSEDETIRFDPSEVNEYPSLCYDDDREAFFGIYTSSGTLERLRIFEIAMPFAMATTLGPRCPAALGFTNNGDDLPYAGSEFSALRVTNAAPRAPVFLVAALAPLRSPLPLPAPGGCSLLIDPATLLGDLGSGVSDASGTFRSPLPIPSVIEGDLFVQAFVLDGADVQSSDALELRIR